MKNIQSLAKIVVLILIFGFLTVSTVGAGTGAPPPPPPPGHGTSGNVPGGGAPVGSGLLILTVLGAAYGGGKYIHKQIIVKNN